MENLEENSKKEFNSWAKTYDNFFNHWYFSHSNKKIYSLIASNIHKNITILDIGCGTGIFIEQFANTENVKIIGVDISEEMVKKAKEKFINQKNISIILGTAVNLPFKNNLFDYVICSNSFHHHPNSDLSLKEMHRVLKSKGRVILLDAFIDGLFRFFYSKVINLIEGKIFHYSKKQIYNLFKKAGFNKIDQQNFGLLHLITIGEKNVMT